MIHFFLRIIRSNYKIGRVLYYTLQPSSLYNAYEKREKKTISANTQTEVVNIIFLLFFSFSFIKPMFHPTFQITPIAITRK